MDPAWMEGIDVHSVAGHSSQTFGWTMWSYMYVYLHVAGLYNTEATALRILITLNHENET